MTDDLEQPQPGPEELAESPPRKGAEQPWRLLWLLAILVGVGAGVGGYTFRYAEGLSYLSTDPKACANCHIIDRKSVV